MEKILKPIKLNTNITRKPFEFYNNVHLSNHSLYIQENEKYIDGCKFAYIIIVLFKL